MSATDSLISRPRVASLFPAAGVALLAAQALLPAFPSATAREVAVAAGHRGAELGSAVAFLVAGILLVLGVMASNALALGRGRTLTRVGLVMTGVGALWPVAGRAAFTAILVTVTGGGVDRASAVATMHAVGDSGAFAIFLPLLLCFAIGPVVLTVGLRRAGVARLWPAIAWIVGVVVVNAAEESSRALAAGGMLLVAAALTGIGVAVASAQSARR